MLIMSVGMEQRKQISNSTGNEDGFDPLVDFLRPFPPLISPSTSSRLSLDNRL